MSHSNIQNPTWNPDEHDEQLFGQMRLEQGLMTLAVAIDICERHKITSGQFDCPWCLVGRVSFGVASTNGHGRAVCSTEGCVKVVQ